MRFYWEWLLAGMVVIIGSQKHRAYAWQGDEDEGLTYPDVERDKDGWPIAPARADRPLWKSDELK